MTPEEEKDLLLAIVAAHPHSPTGWLAVQFDWRVHPKYTFLTRNELRRLVERRLMSLFEEGKVEKEPCGAASLLWSAIEGVVYDARREATAVVEDALLSHFGEDVTISGTSQRNILCVDITKLVEKQRKNNTS